MNSSFGHGSGSHGRLSFIEALEDRRLFAAVVPHPFAATAPPSTTTAIQLHWRPGAPAPIAHVEGEAVGVSGKLYVFGGYYQNKPGWHATPEADVYDPARNSWAALASEPQAITHAGFATDGRYIYLAGGYVSPPKGSQVFGTANVWRYDTQANQWSAFAALPAARGAGTLAIVGRQLSFMGGVDTKRVCHADHWVLNLDDASPRWTVSTPLPAARNHAVVATVNGKIYLMGGQAGTDDHSPAANVFVWDPAHPSTWSVAKSLPQPRSHDVATVINGQIVLANGITTGGSLLSSVIAYNPTTNAWTNLASVPKAYSAPVGGFVGGELIIVSGSYSNLLMKTTWFSGIT